MTDLERQCEEIRNQYPAKPEWQQAHWSKDPIRTLLAYIDELKDQLVEAQRFGSQAQRTILSLELEIAGYYNAHAVNMARADAAREMSNTWHVRAEAHRQAKEFADKRIEKLEGGLWKIRDFLAPHISTIVDECDKALAASDGQNSGESEQL